MINILSYIGMSLQSEVCVWTILGLLRIIFDATLFKVNANLKQVWQMQMPVELSMAVQRVLRTMICGLMLVQCFTVYIYLASYIVLLYPVFLEERPTLVLPWLLLAAIRNLLCELASLALGLGVCVLIGPARAPCIKFVLLKLASIMPAVYMWLLVFSYYHCLKVASTFKTFPAVSPSKDLDYGLELAVRRRRTKTLLGEDQVRKKLMDSLYCTQNVSTNETQHLTKIEETYKSSSNSSNEDIQGGTEIYPLPIVSTKTLSDIGRYEEWLDSEVLVPRDTDRILEQIVLMLLRIGIFLGKETADTQHFLSTSSQPYLPQAGKVQCISTEDTETPPLVGSSKVGRMASYLREYPQIFMKKPSGLLVPLSSPIRLHDMNTKLENNISAQSLQTKDISLDSVSLNFESDDLSLITNDINELSDSLIHSQQNINESMSNKQIENIENGSKASNYLYSNLSDSIEGIDKSKINHTAQDAFVQGVLTETPSANSNNSFKVQHSKSSNTSN